MRLVHCTYPGTRWLAPLLALALVSCGGGGGSSGVSGGSSLTPAATQAAGQELVHVFAASLAGAQVVPPRPTAGSGAGTVVINPATRIMTATLTTAGIAGIDATIQQAQPGVNGPIIFLLSETARGSGTWTARATLSDAQVSALRAGDFYFNVRSTLFGDGEIRGQITSQTAGTLGAGSTGATATTGTTATAAGLNPFALSNVSFVAALRGAQQVPATGSAAQGSATALLNPSTRQLTAAITTAGISATGAALHEGPSGTAGPALFSLAETVPGSGIWVAAVTLSETQIASLQAGNMYFSVRSAAFPNGEIRGQILPQQVAQFVTGTAGNTGILPLPIGTATTGSGLPGTGTTGIGTTGIGTTGIGTTGIGTSGIGTSGIGTTGIGSTGTGTGGFGLTGSLGSASPEGGLVGTPATGTGTFGTGLAF